MEERRGRRPGEQTKVETKLAQWRVKRGMTQEELANAVGMPLSTYWNLERGRNRNPGLGWLSNCAIVLGCKLEDLIEDGWRGWYQQHFGKAPKPADPKALWR